MLELLDAKDATNTGIIPVYVHIYLNFIATVYGYTCIHY